jgi:tRNA1(Val) A37 N6-methylase TrmN6
MPRRPAVRYSAAAHEPPLARAARRASGVYYTPPEVARQLAELTLVPMCQAALPAIQVLDPACGAGELLLAARDVTVEHGRRPAALHGIDIDEQATNHCQQRLREPSLPIHIRHGDALAAEPPLPLGTFDAVLANPPYVSIRELARQHTTDYICELRQRFQTARGNFDLYVLFIERCLAWLRPGGRCGLIVPNKWATLDYARPCRELLAEQATIDQVVDLSAHRVFREASVYPHLLVFTKRLVSQPRHSITGTFTIGGSLPVESQVPTQTFGSLARLACGTPGYAAAKIGSLLAEAEAAPSPALPFITSGNIDRYAIRTGNVRYQGRLWRDPSLVVDDAMVTKRQRQLFASPKLVIAGLTRRLEAAWDSRGLALGVQVFAATEFQLDPFYLLALLNSKLLSYLFRTRFAAKRLGGGYLAVNKGQLVKLPIAVSQYQQSLNMREQLTILARSLTASESADCHHADREIDRLVYQLYRLRPSQIAVVEEHFASLDSARLAAA